MGTASNQYVKELALFTVKQGIQKPASFIPAGLKCWLFV